MKILNNGDQQYHMVQVREVESSNLSTPTGVHMALIRED
jgi:hypothetical protein